MSKMQTGSNHRSQEVWCPHCFGQRIKRDGTTIKGFQRFFCHECRRYWQDGYIRQRQPSRAEQKRSFDWNKINAVLSDHLIAFSSAAKHSAISDFLLDYPKAPYHGLLLEMNSNSKKETMDEICPISHWSKTMRSGGYKVKVVHDWQEAIQKITEYLNA